MIAGLRARWPFLRLLPRWIGSWIRVELRPALRDPAGPALGLRQRGVRVERGRVYAVLGRRRLRLDVYRSRRPAAGPRPAVVNVHGGAWVIGSRREQARPLLGLLAARGWIGFNVDYRLCPGVTLDEQVADVKLAIGWIREHAAELGVDPRFVALTGGSAGGHLAALVALTGDDPTRQPGFEQVDARVQAAIPWYGVHDLPGTIGDRHPGLARMICDHVVAADPRRAPQRFARASPIAQVHAGAPPFLVIHGDADSLVPVAESRRFVAALRARSDALVRYREVAGGEHGFDLILSRRSAPVLAEAASFLDTAWRAVRDTPGSR